MKKKILISVSALLVIILLLGLLQALLVPKYIENPEGRLTAEYYNNSGSHDVLFVGDCEVYESFVPSVMWQEHGITSYIRGSAQQLAWQSYYLLEETFKYETPKVVVFNVLALKYGTPQSEAFNRMTLDGMKWSSSKWNAIKASMTEDESIVEYMLPLLRYHSRITELKAEDFAYWLNSPKAISDNGYLLQTAISPMTEEDIVDEGKPLLDYTLPQSSMDYLEKMRLLCEEKGSELVLIKSPTNSWGYWWYDEWEEQILEYAQSKGLAYYNFIPLCDEIGIDWSHDTYDAGVHLNVYGAEKLTKYFGQILSQNHGITSRKNESETARVWNEHLNIYNERKKNMEDSEK